MDRIGLRSHVPHKIAIAYGDIGDKSAEISLKNHYKPLQSVGAFLERERWSIFGEFEHLSVF